MEMSKNIIFYKESFKPFISKVIRALPKSRVKTDKGFILNSSYLEFQSELLLDESVTTVIVLTDSIALTTKSDLGHLIQIKDFVNLTSNLEGYYGMLRLNHLETSLPNAVALGGKENITPSEGIAYHIMGVDIVDAEAYSKYKEILEYNKEIKVVFLSLVADLSYDDKVKESIETLIKSNSLDYLKSFKEVFRILQIR